MTTAPTTSRATAALRARQALPLLLAAASLLTLGACRTRDKGEGPYARKVAEYVPRIEEITGLRFKTPPKVEPRTRAQVREFVVARFEEQYSAGALAGEEAALKALGLIPESMDIRKFYLDLLTEQIAGFYDPRAKTLYVVEDQRDDLVGAVLAHELVHALQDQYLNLDSIQKATNDADRQAAAQSVLEGQATYDGMAVMLGGRARLGEALPGGWERMREMIRQEQASKAPIFSSAPTIIQESLIFPYLSGADFMRRYYDRKPDGQVFTDMPVSTEQILQTRAYFGEPRDAPTIVTLPDSNASVIHQNTLGEFATRIFLFDHTRDQSAAVGGATGWDGDRLRIVRTPAGNAVYWVSVWDSPVDAAEFVFALSMAVEKRYGAGAPDNLPGDVRRWTARNRTMQLVPGTVNGRTVVMYVDVPTGQPMNAVDLKRVTLD